MKLQNVPIPEILTVRCAIDHCRALYSGIQNAISITINDLPTSGEALGEGKGMTRFDSGNLPDLNGKVALITGANSGLGIETAKAMAAKGARIIMACRNADKAAAAASDIRAFAPNAAVDIRQLDLGDLASVAAFCDDILATESKLDFLINNAGLMSGVRADTKDGFELQFGTNHLGHFAMNAKLLPLVEAAGGRIVGLGSMSHKFVKNHTLDDVQWRARAYNAIQSYAESKLANMLYIHELGKRLKAAQSPAMAVMAHPGFSATSFGASGDMATMGKFKQTVTLLFMRLFAQPQAQGAWPTLLAATDPAAQQGDYYGPMGRREMRGDPGKAKTAANARHDGNAEKLWTISEELTGQTFTV